MADVLAPPPPPKSPRADVPVRRPGSVRRSTAVDMVFVDPEEPVDGTAARLVLRASARDVVTDLDGRGRAVGETRLTAWVDEANRLLRLDVDPPEPRTAGLIGRGVSSGFRRAATEAVPELHDQPLGQLLDDVPVAVLVSGYAWMRDQEVDGALERPDVPPRVEHFKADICSGWRSDGTMLVHLRTGKGMPVPQTPPVIAPPRGGDPYGDVALPVLPVRAMRRRRRIDVLPGTGGATDAPFAVEAWFRDSYVDAAGTEGALHEYTVRAGFAGAGEGCRVTIMEAASHVLPHPECPWATEHVGDLVGQAAAELRTGVIETLNGIRCCTHLNDLLRSLAAVPYLAGQRPTG
jgi:hypothetical protein